MCQFTDKCIHMLTFKEVKEELKFYSLGIFCKAAETYTFGYLSYDFVVWNN